MNGKLDTASTRSYGAEGNGWGVYEAGSPGRDETAGVRAEGQSEPIRVRHHDREAGDVRAQRKQEAGEVVLYDPAIHGQLVDSPSGRVSWTEVFRQAAADGQTRVLTNPKKRNGLYLAARRLGLVVSTRELSSGAIAFTVIGRRIE